MQLTVTLGNTSGLFERDDEFDIDSDVVLIVLKSLGSAGPYDVGGIIIP